MSLFFRKCVVEQDVARCICTFPVPPTQRRGLRSYYEVLAIKQTHPHTVLGFDWIFSWWHFDTSTEGGIVTV